MKPKDLTLEQLKAIPLEDYSGGHHNETGDAICADVAIDAGDCYLSECECVECILTDADSVNTRITELENKKDMKPEDLTLKRLKAIPLGFTDAEIDERDKACDSMSCGKLACNKCPLFNNEAIRNRITKLENKKP